MQLLGLVIGFTALVVVLDVLCLNMSRWHILPSNSFFVSVLSFILVGLGLIALGGFLFFCREFLSEIGMFPKIGSLFFYLACALIYIEVRSLLSRGYSFRILIDMLNADGVSTMENLKNNYGGGKGLEGLLDKRLDSLAGFGLIIYREGTIGPLTKMGTLLAWGGATVRQVLCLRNVG